jgi:two-component system, NarL family, nitrate/nitrite response regulator NarL
MSIFDEQEKCEAFVKALELVMLGETILPLELLSFFRKTLSAEAQLKTTQDVVGIAPGFPPVKKDDLPSLSFRETCILRCIVDGASNKIIARKLDITEATVKVHVKAILRKIRVHNRTQAAIWATKYA